MLKEAAITQFRTCQAIYPRNEAEHDIPQKLLSLDGGCSQGSPETRERWADEVCRPLRLTGFPPATKLKSCNGLPAKICCFRIQNCKTELVFETWTVLAMILQE